MAETSSASHQPPSGGDDNSSEDERSNRWDGQPSTWKRMNRNEIDTLTALDEIRNKDLAVHLYNAFALKKRHAEPGSAKGLEPLPGKDINAVTGQLVHEDDWVPQRSWTAWPMRKDRVPADEFMRRLPTDVDDCFTIRKLEIEVPSFPLQESISATVLRFARERFESRAWDDAEMDEEIGDESDALIEEGSSASETESEAGRSTRSRPESRPRSRSRARSRSKSVKLEHGNEDERLIPSEGEMDVVDDDTDSDSEKSVPLKEPNLRPVVTGDDDLSYELLAPSIRSILTTLDATLMVLHRSRDATVNYVSDPSDDSEGSEASERTRRSGSRGSEPPAKKRRGRPLRADLVRRPRLPQQPDENQQMNERPPESPNQGVLSPKKRVGRPRKAYPRLEGENDRAYAIRVARIRKEPNPFFDEAAESEDPKSSASEIQAHSNTRTSRPKSAKARKATPERSKRSRSRSQRRNAVLGLRTWKDVLRAASIAGFSQSALDRAARRCADLFGESLELRTLSETPLGQACQDEVTQYHPGMATDLSPGLYDENETDGEDVRSQTKRYIRASSAISDDRSRGRGRSRSRSRSMSRSSRSRSVSVACSHFCPVRGCERAVEGFSRRTNMVRHVQLVHDMEENEIPTEIDSEDEMLGAVHVDGYLKPIKIRKGWRGDDIRAEGEPKRKYGGRYSRRGRFSSRPGDTDGEDQDVPMQLGDDESG